VAKIKIMLKPLIPRNLLRVKAMSGRITNMCNLDERSAACMKLIKQTIEWGAVWNQGGGVS
jgi:hypothetical protein